MPKSLGECRVIHWELTLLQAWQKTFLQSQIIFSIPLNLTIRLIIRHVRDARQYRLHHHNDGSIRRDVFILDQKTTILQSLLADALSCGKFRVSGHKLANPRYSLELIDTPIEDSGNTVADN
jgi:hypothetical protein